MNKFLYAATAVAVALVPSVAMAQARTQATQSGTTANGISWIAQSTIVGATSTGTTASGGNPLYLATNQAGYSGVAGLYMTYADGSAFVCSGALSGGRIITAAHCVSDGFRNGVNGVANGLVRTQAFFSDGSNPDPYFYPLDAQGNLQPGIVSVDVSGYNIHSGYTGEVIDQNDIAVLTLATAAPTFAQDYGLYTTDINGLTFNVAGLGGRSSTGGAVGTTSGTGPGRRRQGDNVYDFRLGEEFGAVGNSCGPNRNQTCVAEFEYSYVSDFDNGLAANDTHCLLFGRCTGTELLEVSIAGGDSGGPAFIDGKLASVNSYGLTFGRFCLVPLVNGACPAGQIGGDFRSGLQSSWGETNGFVPIFIHQNFIANVPEPSTWALLILGFGLTGSAMRRRGKVQARYAF